MWGHNLSEKSFPHNVDKTGAPEVLLVISGEIITWNNLDGGVDGVRTD